MSHRARKYRVIIVGAGLAGISAARILAESKADVLLLDEAVQPGGHYLKRPSPPMAGNPAPAGPAMRTKGLEIIKVLKSSGLDYRPCTQVLGIDADGRAGWEVWGETVSGALECWRSDIIIIAGGAREQFIPFKGWTLPGVISTGAVQLLLKGAGVLPAPEIVVAGSGPLPLVVAGELVKAGARVPALLDYASLALKLGVVKLGAMAIGKVWEGLRHQIRIIAAGGRLRNSCAVLEARGEGHLEEIVTVRLDREGKPIAGSETAQSTQCLAVGHGFAPNLELAQQAGCELEYDPNKGGWIVKVDESLRTSLPGCYAAGEVTGIAGAEKSHIEGCMAGLAAAKDLGHMPECESNPGLDNLYRRRSQQLRIGGFINSLCHTPRDLWDLVDDNTIICRCEDVTMGDIRAQIKSGTNRPRGIKLATRSGMGSCQGRTCGPMLEAMIQAMHGMDGEAPPLPLSARMPVKPFQLSALVDMNLEEET